MGNENGLIGEPCKRKVIEIRGENFYLVVGQRRVDVTVPRENAPDQSEVREVSESLCAEITELLEELWERDNAKQM